MADPDNKNNEANETEPAAAPDASPTQKQKTKKEKTETPAIFKYVFGLGALGLICCTAIVLVKMPAESKKTPAAEQAEDVDGNGNKTPSAEQAEDVDDASSKASEEQDKDAASNKPPEEQNKDLEDAAGSIKLPVTSPGDHK